MNKDNITIVLVTSVLPSHPDTRVIDQAVRDIRSHFPDNEIIMQIDGLREEQSYRKADYDEYKNRVLWKCMHEWKNVVPFVFDEHSHQSTMMMQTIHEIRTGLMLLMSPRVKVALVKGSKLLSGDWIGCFSTVSLRPHLTISVMPPPFPIKCLWSIR